MIIQSKTKRGICKICGKYFIFRNPWNKKTCSFACNRKNADSITKERNRKKVIKKCQKCGKEFEGLYRYTGLGKCGACLWKEMSEKRKGTGNPAYRNGSRIKGKKIDGLHLRMCSKYRKEFLDKNGYLFCELCRVNQNGTPRFEVHHIYYASLYPKHKELHNHKNMVLLCIQCHNNMHSGKMRSGAFNKLEKVRGLKELFAIT